MREVLAGWPRVSDAVAVVSELSANAVLHSRSGGPEGRFTVRTEASRGVTYVAVEDAGGCWDRPREVVPQHGLDLVQALAGPGNWGISGDETGRTVWVCLPWPGTGPPESWPQATGLTDLDGEAMIADLDKLAVELTARGLEAQVEIPPGSQPHLAIRLGTVAAPASAVAAPVSAVAASAVAVAAPVSAVAAPAVAVAAPAERVYAQADWYFWPTAERIAARDDVATAAAEITRVLGGATGP